MATLYTIFKVAALLAIILIPLIGPKAKKIKGLNIVSKLAVTENGGLENLSGKSQVPHHVQ